MIREAKKPCENIYAIINLKEKRTEVMKFDEKAVNV